MSVTPTPPPPAVAFCGRCGAPAAPGVTFCGRCGNRLAPLPAAAAGYSYPVVAAATVPAAHVKLPPARLAIAAAAVVALVVIVITVVSFVIRPGLKPHCIFACGPPVTGAALVDTTNSYHNSRWNFTVQYMASTLAVTSNDDNSVQLQQHNGLPLAFIKAEQGSDPSAAVAAEVSDLGNQSIQDMQQAGPVPGAQIGEIPASGVALTGVMGGQDGGTPVALEVMAATHDNVTVVAVVIDEPSQRNQVTGISSVVLGYVITEFRWPGSA